MIDFRHFFGIFRFKTSKQALFSAWTALMIIFVIGVIMKCSLFLATQLKLAFDEGPTREPASVQFDIKGYEQLHLSQ
jgi:hypothetical protein